MVSDDKKKSDNKDIVLSLDDIKNLLRDTLSSLGVAGAQQHLNNISASAENIASRGSSFSQNIIEKNVSAIYR